MSETMLKALLADISECTGHDGIEIEVLLSSGAVARGPWTWRKSFLVICGKPEDAKEIVPQYWLLPSQIIGVKLI
jgi:hypothetical protein